MKKLFVFIILILLIIGILLIVYRREIIGNNTIVVKQVEQVKIKIEKDTLFVNFKLEIENTSFLDILIDSVVLNTSFLDKNCFQKKSHINKKFKSYSKDTIDFNLKIPYIQIMADLTSEKEKNDSALFVVSGYFNYSTILGSGVYNLNKTFKMKIPQPPEVKVIDIKWKKIRLKKISAEVTFEINNRNDIDFTTQALNYSVKIHNMGKFKGKYSKKIAIKSKSKTYVTLPITITLNGLGKTIKDILKNEDEYYYSLLLDFTVLAEEWSEGTYFIEINKKGKIELKE